MVVRFYIAILARASINQNGFDYFSPRYFLHRASTASLAMRERCFADKVAARALPPFEAPSFESATAAGFFFFRSIFGDMSIN